MSKKILFFTILFLLPLTSSAFTLKTGADVIVPSPESIQGNAYLSGGRVVFDGLINGDLIIASGDVIVNGTINGDLTVISSDAKINGLVSGDIRIVSASADVTASSTGDVVLVGGIMNILDSANLSGPLLSFGDSLYLNNPKFSGINGLNRRVHVNGVFSSNADLTVDRLVIDNEAKVSGKIKYYSPKSADIKSGADISNGEVSFSQIEPWQESGLFKTAALILINFWILLRFITSLFLIFILVNIFKVYTRKINEVALLSPIKNIFFGIASVFAVPLFMLISLVSLFAFPLGIITILIYLVFIVISPAISAVIVGSIFKKLFNKGEKFEFTFLSSVIGLILITLVGFVPHVGLITKYIFFLMALGALIRSLYIDPNKKRFSI